MPMVTCVPAPPGVHFFRNVAGQLNGQLLRIFATATKSSTPTLI